MGKKCKGNWLSLVYFFLVRYSLLRGLFGESAEQVLKRLRRYRLWVSAQTIFSPPRLRVGIVPRGDGGGAQLQASLATFASARQRGLEYVHIPLSVVEHREESREQWVERWNSLFSFPANSGPGTRAFSLDSRFSTLRAVLRYRESAVLCSRGFRKLADRSPRVYENVRKEIRGFYRSEPSRAGREPAAARVLSAHVRRGDVKTVGRASFRYTPNSEILESIGGLVAANQDVQVVIFSNGTLAELQEFVDRGWEVRNELDAIETFRCLIESDVLVMAKSSFSYVAGLVSSGEVWYENFWHPPLPSWKRLDSEAPIQPN